MRVKTNLSVIIAEDPTLNRRVFSVEDIEEADDVSSLGGDGRGNLTIPAEGTHELDLSPLSSIKHLVILVDGDVLVKLNGSETGFRVLNRGISGQADFVWGKLLIAGSGIDSVVLENNSTTSAAKCLIGYAG